MPLFVKRDNKRPDLIKDWMKSKKAERDWNKNRWTHQQGIKEYAHSFEGRKFHRQLGNFLSTHVLIPKNGVLQERGTDKPSKFD